VPLARRRNVIPLAAELVVRDDHHGVLRAAAVLDVLKELDEMVAAVGLAPVAGMLVLDADRLHETYSRELTVLSLRRVGLAHEARLVLQVRPARRAGCVVGEVVERLMVVLELRVRASWEHRVGGAGVRIAAVRTVAVRPPGSVLVADGVRPATGVPRP